MLRLSNGLDDSIAIRIHCFGENFKSTFSDFAGWGFGRHNPGESKLTRTRVQNRVCFVRKRSLIIWLAAALVAAVTIVGISALKQHNELVNCGNQMQSILLEAAMLWPDDHDGHLPTNFISMSNELIIPQILVCPADRSRHPAASWSTFSADNCSYEIVTPGLSKSDTNRVFLRCKIHGYTGYADDRLLDAAGKIVRPNRVW